MRAILAHNARRALKFAIRSTVNAALWVCVCFAVVVVVIVEGVDALYQWATTRD